MAAPLLTPVYSGIPRFVDSTGQRVLLRGVNVQAGAGTTMYQRAVSMGTNMVRISIHWDEGEPSAPQGSGTNWASYQHNYAASFLDAIEAMVSYYGQNGVYVQIDSHQAGWAKVAPFNGFGGIPGWYYTDARFPGHQTLTGACAGAANQAGCAIASWWTSTAEKAASQTFYKAWWAELVRRFSAHPNVVMYQPFNEPNAGSMTGSSQAKCEAMHTWLVPIVDSIRAADSQRAIAIMNRGGGEGYGTVTYNAFGGSAGLIQRKMVIEHHSYYTGLAPGFPADPAIAGQTGYDPAGDNRVPTDAACLNTTANSSYHGALANQENYYSVPISKAQQMGVPLFLGEFGVHAGDPGRLAYVSQMQRLIDAHQLDATVWLLADTGGSANSLNLVTGGALNDMGTAWQTWFKATDFTPAGGGGGGGGGGGAGSLSTSPIAASQTPNFYDPTWTSGSHKGRVDDVVEVNGVTYVAGSYGHVIDVDGTDFGNPGANSGAYAFLSAWRSDTGALIRTWHGDIDGRVRRLVVNNGLTAIFAVGDFNTVAGQARGGVVRISTLSGPTDTSAMNLSVAPGNVAADGPVYDIVIDAIGNRAWVIGGFSNIGGLARRGLALFDMPGGAWTIRSGFNAGRAAFVAGGTGRCLAMKADFSKLVAGWFPGNAGTDVSAHASLSAHDPDTGAALTWTTTVNYTNTAAEHPGAFEMQSDADGVYVSGLHNGGNSVEYYNWNGSGPNALTAQAGQTSDGGTYNGYWYRSTDGNCQSIELGQINNVPVLFIGHHGDVVAANRNTPASSGATLVSHGLTSVNAGPTGGGLAGYGGPPNFSSPPLPSGAATGDPLKLWAIYQTTAGDLLCGGDFTAVNSSAPNSYQRYARFPATSAPTGWNPTPSLSDATPQVGETITVDPGTLAGASSYAYQWESSPTGQTGWVAIGGATSAAYTVQTGDNGSFLRARVTATLAAGGTQTAFATATGAVQPQGSAPVNTGTAPTVTPSSGVTVGTLLTAATSAAQWTPNSGLTFAYQWQRKNLATGTITNIAGQTATTYTTVTADDGNQVRVMVTATQTSSGLTGQAPSNLVNVGSQQTSAVIWYVSDAGASNVAQVNVNNNIPQNGAGVDLIVLGGDFYPRGTASDLSVDVTQLYGPSGKNCLSKVVIQEGNHDWPNRSCAGAFRAFAGTLPKMSGMTSDGIGKLTIAGVDLIFLATDAAATGVVGDCSETTATVTDSQSGLGANQLAQLQAWMAAPGTRKLVFSHKQRYSCGQNHGDISQLADMWAAMQPAQYGGDGGALVHFHGHEHDYQRLRPRDASGRVAVDAGFQAPGVVELCNGCGGEGNYSLNTAYPSKYIAKFRGSATAPQYGMTRITINGDTLTIDAFDKDGVTIYDTVTLTMTGGGGGGGGGGSSPSGGTPNFQNLQGVPAVGDIVTVDSGTWAGTTPMSFAFTFQHSLNNGATWQTASGTGAVQAIDNVGSGNAQASYIVDGSDQAALLRCVIAVTNSAGSATGITAVVGPVAVVGTGRPVLITAPAVTPTSPLVGTQLHATTGAWHDPANGTLTYTYDWKSYSPQTGTIRVVQANLGPSYTTQSSDTGLMIFCTVTAANAAGTASADSNRTSTVSSTQITISDEIDTADAQTIPSGTPFTVVWESHTTAPGGVITSQIRVDNGTWLNGQKIQDDGAGGGVWQYTFQTLSVGTHTIETQDIAQG